MNIPACLEYQRSGNEEGVVAVHGVIGKDLKHLWKSNLSNKQGINLNNMELFT